MLALPDPPLGDGVVRLREPAGRDLHAVVSACRDPSVQRYTRVPVPYEEADGRAFIGGAPCAGHTARAAADDKKIEIRHSSTLRS